MSRPARLAKLQTRASLTPQKKPAQLLGLVRQTLSALAVLFLLPVFLFRPDWAAAVTLFPAWFWLPLALPIIWSWRVRSGQALALLWLCFALFCVEEWRPLLRTLRPAPNAEQALHLISVNVHSKAEPLTTLLANEPDLILMQESPRHTELQQILAAYPDYQLSYGFDCSIIARGTVQRLGASMRLNHARVTIDGREFEVLTLHLIVSDPRFDLWNPACWREGTAKRLIQRKQLETILAAAALVPNSSGQLDIIGGDFNVPQRDAIFRLLSPTFHDSARGTARGWPNTIFAKMPVHRIDQVWTSDELPAIRSRARQAPGSDHRAWESWHRLD